LFEGSIKFCSEKGVDNRSHSIQNATVTSMYNDAARQLSSHAEKTYVRK